MDPSQVEKLIEAGVPDAEATVRNPRGDGEHFEAVVVSRAFDGETLVAQHQIVYDALGDHMTTDIHALELKTYAPDEVPEPDG